MFVCFFYVICVCLCVCLCAFVYVCVVCLCVLVCLRICVFKMKNMSSEHVPKPNMYTHPLYIHTSTLTTMNKCTHVLSFSCSQTRAHSHSRNHTLTGAPVLSHPLNTHAHTHTHKLKYYPAHYDCMLSDILLYTSLMIVGNLEFLRHVVNLESWVPCLKKVKPRHPPPPPGDFFAISTD